VAGRAAGCELVLLVEHVTYESGSGFAARFLAAQMDCAAVGLGLSDGEYSEYPKLPLELTGAAGPMPAGKFRNFPTETAAAAGRYSGSGIGPGAGSPCAGPGADVGRSRRRCGPVPPQM
jgi:hypothetical protein